MSLRPSGPIQFVKPWLVVCEGMSDKIVVNNLIKRYNLSPDKYQVCIPSNDYRIGGISKMAKWLGTTSLTSSTFATNVKAVLILADCDDDRAATLTLIQRGLAEENLPVPTRTGVGARIGQGWSLAICLVPLNENGSLETMCLRAARRKWPAVGTALDAYVAGTGVDAWTASQQRKMQMQCTISATCSAKPSANLITLWQERDEFHIPLDEQDFQDVISVLRDFPTMIMDPESYTSPPAPTAASARRNALRR